ncbi:MAG TPA: hypothetical protein VK972_06065, partial [Wenzhouxiangella sp.]|nr:hypothetical protein [Wenzhouxiangella sp.]
LSRSVCSDLVIVIDLFAQAAEVAVGDPDHGSPGPASTAIEPRAPGSLPRFALYGRNARTVISFSPICDSIKRTPREQLEWFERHVKNAKATATP